MKLSEAQAMLTRLQYLAGEWAEQADPWSENNGSSDYSRFTGLCLSWGNSDPDNDDGPGVWLSVHPDKSQLETWADGAETNYIVNPTPAQVDAAVKRVMEEVMEP